MVTRTSSEHTTHTTTPWQADMFLDKVGRYSRDFFKSRIVHLGAFAVTSATYTAVAWPLSLTGIAYAYFCRKRISDEFVTFYMDRYPLPDSKSSEAHQTNGIWTFYKTQRNKPLYDVVGAVHAIDLVVKGTNGASLYVGSHPTEKMLPWIQKQGVSDVVSMVEEFEYDMPTIYGTVIQADEWEKHGITLHHYPSTDHQLPSHAVMERSANQIVRLLSQGKSVLVHCKMGMGRAPTIAALAIRKMLNISDDTVFDLVQKARPQLSKRSVRTALLAYSDA